MIRKATIKGLIILTLLIAVLTALNPIFILKSEHRSTLIEGLYNHTGDSYDVVFMGGSHMNGGLDPNTLWHNYGIQALTMQQVDNLSMLPIICLKKF